MFKFLDKIEENIKHKQKISDLTTQLDTLEVCYKNLATKFQEQQDMTYTESADCRVSVNWAAITPASIERIVVRENGYVRARTEIGFLVPGTIELKSWCFYCSTKRHEELVEEFMKHTKKS